MGVVLTASRYWITADRTGHKNYPPAMGSPAVGAWVAHIAFWVLVPLGISREALSKRAAVIFAALWLVGCVGLPRTAWWAGSLVTTWVAVLDIALVFVVFKGDVRVT